MCIPLIRPWIIKRGDGVIKDSGTWICMLIKNIPAIEIKRGKWTHGINENFRTCSACNISMGLSEGENLSRFKYCPFCGAKMEVEP